MEAGRSPNIEILTNATLLSIDGGVGRFSAKVQQNPRYVDEKLCTACGACTVYCPVPVADSYNEGLCKTKALHIDYQQAIPAAFHVDENACRYLTKRECRQCEHACAAKAVNLKQQPKEIDLEVGAVILAPGFGRISKETLARYGYGRSRDVVTGVEFERITSASGPTMGEIVSPSDGKHPKKIAFLQCIGSRDLPSGNGYCSSVCCMYAVKEALVAKDHDPNLDIAIFYMDMRTQGKEFDQARLRARDKGIRFVRSRFGRIHTGPDGLEIKYVNEDGKHVREAFDLVVLPEGLDAPEDAALLAAAAGIELNPYDFCSTRPFGPLETSRPGIYRGRRVPGPQGRARQRDGCKRGRGAGRRGPVGCQKHPRRGEELPGGGEGRRGAPDRGVRLRVREQHRRGGGCEGCGRLRLDARERGLHRHESLQLRAEHAGPDPRQDPGQWVEPGGGGCVHAPHPRAALSGDPEKRVPQPVPFRNGQHPGPLFLGPCHGAQGGHGEIQGPGADGGGQGAAHPPPPGAERAGDPQGGGRSAGASRA